MPLPAAVVGGAIALNLGGSLLSGFAANRAAKRQARQIEENARNQFNADLLQAGEIRREGDRTLSDALAAIAAGGGDASSAGSVDQLAKLDREYEYNRLGFLYDASLRKQGALDQARAIRKGGKEALVSSLIGGAGSALSTYAASK